MPSEAERLALVVFDGAFARVHYALVMASAAAATNRRVVLFFTGRALKALLPEGWRQLDGDPAAQEAAFAARGIAGFPALLEACRELGVRFIACEMGLRAEGLTPEALDPALAIDIAGVVTLLNEAENGPLVFI